MERWPNLFIVGAPKAGTTSLYEYLKKNPGIFMSPIKEPNFFALKIIPENSYMKPIRDQKKYLSLFKNAKEQKILGEASPNYLSDPEAPFLIHQVNPNASIIILLRDPIERLFSHYLMYYSRGRVKLSFDKMVKDVIEQENYVGNEKNFKLSTSLYSDDVSRYLEVFGAKQIKIIIFEEFIKNPKRVVEEILDFLKINKNIDYFQEKKHNPYSSPRIPFAQKIWTSGTIRRIVRSNLIPKKSRNIIRDKILFKRAEKPDIKQEIRRELIEYYQEDVKKLEKILKRKLNWKNF